MYIKTAVLHNFRNYSDLKINFEPKLNILSGKNAQGKTNLLEALYFCCIGKSFRTSKEKEVIRWENEFTRIVIDVEKKYGSSKIEIIFPKSGKKTVKINGIPIKKIGELLGELNIVFFSPEELKLIKSSPEERRRFMDIALSQMDKKYFYHLNRYEKVLDNRNKLLKSTTNKEVIKDTIDIWNTELVNLADYIIKKRSDFVEKLTPYASLAHSYLTEDKENLQLKYITSVIDKDDIRPNLLKMLEKNFDKDCKLGYTTIGPHRDEIDVYINDVEVKNFGSQGQQRTAALSMKLAELELIKENSGEMPVLLLDDVLSELDSSRRKRLLKFTEKAQTFITCTDFDYNVKSKMYTVDNGKICEVAPK